MTLKTAIVCLATIGYLASGCGGSSTVATIDTPPSVTTTDAPAANISSEDTNSKLIHKTYTESDAAILNPERGYFYWTDLLESNYSNARELGYTLIYARVFLKDYVDKPLDDILLQKLEKAFQNVRQAGVKCILRFSYSDATEVTTDASLALILQHIAQLKPVLRENADVIYTMQAGFIGRWGEWHSSTNGLDKDSDAQKKILDAILDALPSSRQIQVRTPMFKESYATLNSANATRVGHHNDCFLASPTDFGTYPDGAMDIWKETVAADGLTTPVGGETCFLNSPRSDCDAALEELAALHFSYLNGSTGDGVTAAWKSQGCFDKIGNQLGYRLVLTDSLLNDHVHPGEVLNVQLNITNDGFSPLYYSRTAYLMLKGAETYTSVLDIDLTQLTPGMKQTIETNITLSDQMSEGTYTLSLWMPDPTATLKNNPNYDILLANTDGNVVGTIVVDREDLH